MHKKFSKPSITLIASNPSSILNFRGELIKKLQELDYGIEIILPKNSTEKDLEPLRKNNFKLILIPISPNGFNPLRDIITLLFFYLYFKKNKPSHVLAYTIKPVIYGLLAARLANIKNRTALITGLGSMFVNINSFKKRCLLKIIKTLYQLALGSSSTKAVIFQNPDDRDFFIQQKIINTHQAFIINGSGVDLNYFYYAPYKINTQQAAPIKFLMLSRLIKDKGIFEFLEAIKIIKNKYPETQFLLAGGTHKNPSAISIQIIHQWVDQNLLTYLGELSDVRPAIEAASVYVLPSYREGTPRSVLEAMSMGRAIITTDAPGCRETVSDGQNGFLVPVKSVEALAQAMEKFILNPDLIVQMGQKSREIAEAKYDVHQVNQEILRTMRI